MFEGYPLVDPAALAGEGLLPDHPAKVVAALSELDHVDNALVNACLTVEHELREQAYRHVERLLRLVVDRPGALDARVLALPDVYQARALLDLYMAGWVDSGA